MLSVTVEDDQVRIGDRLVVSFQRTLRIPEAGGPYPLPAGLGRFPLHRVRDYRERAPAGWQQEHALFIPVYQREALWLGFEATAWKPNALQVWTGGVNALSGDPYRSGLHADPQDYLVCPPQPWLDGVYVATGVVRQFVAMPLGLGYSVEAALTGEERVGGIQLRAYDPRPGLFPDRPPRRRRSTVPLAAAALGPEMGLGAGGSIAQKIYPDPFGIEAWDAVNHADLVVYLVSSAQYRALTGLEPPPTPVTAADYRAAELPWFALYDETAPTIPAQSPLARAKTIAQRDAERNVAGEGDAISVDPTTVRRLHRGTDAGTD